MAETSIKARRSDELSTHVHPEALEIPPVEAALETQSKRDGSVHHEPAGSTSPQRASFVIEEEEGRLASNLPPVDGGRGAWSYLTAATVLEMLVWGLPSAYGVFLTVYTDVWPDQTGILPSVGTVATGMMYLLLPPVAWYLAKRPWWRQSSMWLGMGVATVSLLGAAFAKEAWQLLLTQGVGFATGGILLYCPVTAYMFEWWQQRRGLAIGIMYSGTGIGGLTVPFIASGLLQAYGRRTTLLSFAVGYAVLLTATIPFIRSRIPIARSRQGAGDGVAPIRWDFLGTRAFWTLFLGVLLQALGGFVPPTFLPSFARSLNLNTTAGTLSIALINLARVPGQVLLGHLSDKMGIRKLIIIMGCISSLSVYLLWGLAASEPVLLVFSLCFGAFAGSYTALFPRFIAICANNDPQLPQILYAFFSFARGCGNICSGPVATRLLELPGFSRVGGGYGVGSYGLLIVWTGAMLLGSGVGASYKGLKRD